MDVYSLVYISSTEVPFTGANLEALLESSRKRNHAMGITGMLLYKDGSFMQYLEGSRDHVTRLMKKIRVDPRHSGLVVLLEEERAERLFADWSMGFKKYRSDDPIEIPGYSHFLDLPLTSEQFLQNPSRALRLLLSFKKTVGAV
jgi:hypothetical protein